MNVPDIVNNIFSVTSQSFLPVALQVFRYQYQQNKVYRSWVDHLHIDATSVQKIEEIPFLPVSFFKSETVISGIFEPKIIFESSGTTQTSNSRHLVKDVDVYTTAFTKGFNIFYGDVRDWCIIGLLPSYLERNNSSLVFMVDELIRSSGHTDSGFYLYNYADLHQVLKKLESQGQKTLVIGVTFALLDFAEQFPMSLKHTIIMETGGMKGRKEELVRAQVHALLQKGFGVDAIHSEYGMTELLSQAYSKGDGLYQTVPWMKILLRDEDDPLHVKTTGRGVANIIDLANIHSCSFIATDDAATVFEDGSFEILGRVDNSDIRGCSLMVV